MNQTNRLWLVTFVAFTLASLAGLPAAAQKPLHGLLGLRNQSVLCQQLVKDGSVRHYRVRHTESGGEIRISAGRSRSGDVLICACTPDLLPLFAPYVYNPIEGLNLNSPDAAEKLMERSQSAVLTGRITVLFIPSLRVQALDVPFRAQGNYVQLETGYFPQYGTEVTEITP